VVRALLVVGLLAVAPSAFANPADLFGLGGPSMGRGQTGIVLDADAYAAWRNPATMGLAEQSEFSFGGHYGWFRLNCLGEQSGGSPPICERNILYDGNQDGLVQSSQGQDYWPEESYENPGGIQFGYLAAAGKYFRIGFGLHLPGKRIVLFEQHDPYLPYYLRWKSRSQRLGIYLAGSFRIVPGLYVGVGVSVLARGRIDLKFDVDANISDDDITAGDEGGGLAVDLIVNPGDIGGDIRLALAPIIGVTWDLGNLTPKLEGVRIGVVYRHPIQILIEPAVLNLDFNAVIQEIGSLGDVLIPIRAQLVYSAVDFGTPRQVAVGLGWSKPRFQLAVDITWNQWSAIVPNTARIDEALTDVEIGLVDLQTRILNSRQLDNLGLKDTVSIRVGGEFRPPGKSLSGKVGSRFREVGVVVRGGYGYEGAFTPEQTGLTNLLDNPVHSLSAGFGIWTYNPVPTIDGKVSMDLFFQAHVLQERTHVKEGDYEEGAYPEGWPTLGEVRSGGVIPTLGATLSLGL